MGYANTQRPAAAGGSAVYESTVYVKGGADASGTASLASGGFPLEIYHNETGVSRTVAGIDVIVAGELTADNTDSLSLTFYLYEEDTSIAELGALSTTTIGAGGTGNWSGVEVFDTGIDDVVVAAGRSIRFADIKNNAGVISPPYSIRIRWVQP